MVCESNSSAIFCRRYTAVNQASWGRELGGG